jgi:hypothetical protein
MSDEITNLKNGINNTLIGSIKSKIPDSGFGVATFDCIQAYSSDKGQRVTQFITTNETTVKQAVNAVVYSSTGSREPHYDALYYSATGEARGTVGATNCSGKEGSIGGACFRNGALPIFIMMTDEKFVNNDNLKNATSTYAAMNNINAKFIGVNSSSTSSNDPESNLKAVGTNTGSVDGSGNPFYYKINSNGTGLSTSVADGVAYLAANVPMLVNTGRESIANPQSVDVTQFIKAITPIKRVVGGSTVNCPTECTNEAFQNVKPGTTVTFDIDFHNDFYEPTSSVTTVFRAKINVFGEGSLVDSREVYVIVPGKIGTGPGN